MASTSAPRPRTDRIVTIEAQPGALDIDMDRTAIIVVDMQNDFGAKGGMFDRANIDLSSIRSAVEPTAKVLDAARNASIPIVYLKMAFAPDLSDAGPSDAPNLIKHAPLRVGAVVTAPDGSESRILIRDTWNTDVIDELTPAADDLIVVKTRYSGFFNTELDERLTSLGIKYLIVTGCTTSVCVESTVRDAMFRDYSCVVLADCTGEPIAQDAPRSNHDASLAVIQAVIGWSSDSATIIAAFDQAADDTANVA